MWKYWSIWMVVSLLCCACSVISQENDMAYPDYFIDVDLMLWGYHTRNGRYPTTDEGLAVLLEADTELLPTDKWGNAIRYRFVGSADRHYVLESEGPPDEKRPISSERWKQFIVEF